MVLETVHVPLPIHLRSYVSHRVSRPSNVNWFLNFWASRLVAFVITPLVVPYSYLGPPVDGENACECSSVYYVLLNACAACQKGQISRYGSSPYHTLFMLRSAYFTIAGKNIAPNCESVAISV